jgi:hypothetical protein
MRPLELPCFFYFHAQFIEEGRIVWLRFLKFLASIGFEDAQIDYPLCTSAETLPYMGYLERGVILDGCYTLSGTTIVCVN